jgi:hypothetical protein
MREADRFFAKNFLTPPVSPSYPIRATGVTPSTNSSPLLGAPSTSGVMQGWHRRGCGDTAVNLGLTRWVAGASLGNVSSWGQDFPRHPLLFF